MVEHKYSVRKYVKYLWGGVCIKDAINVAMTFGRAW